MKPTKGIKNQSIDRLCVYYSTIYIQFNVYLYNAVVVVLCTTLSKVEREKIFQTYLCDYCSD